MAGKILRKHYPKPPRWSHDEDLSALIYDAQIRAHRSWVTSASSDFLLLALLDRSETNDPALRDDLLRLRGVERASELDELKPWPGLHAFKVQVHVSQYRYEAALHEAQAALADEPDSFDAHTLHATAQGIRGDYTAVLAEVEWMLASEPNESNLSRTRGIQCDAYLGLDRLDDARRILPEVYTEEWLAGYRHCLFASVELALGHPETALNHCAEALLAPYHPNSLHETRAEALTDLGRADEARAAYRLFVRDATEYGLHAPRAEERLALARAALTSQ